MPRGEGEARAPREALARVGLKDFEHAYPRELSGGMKMRVSIARALAARPQLLLMDEPFAALDEITRQRLNDDLLALWREDGITVMFVTHSVTKAAIFRERVLVMTPRPGRIAADIALPSGPRDRLSPATSRRNAQISDALDNAGWRHEAHSATSSCRWLLALSGAGRLGMDRWRTGKCRFMCCPRPPPSCRPSWTISTR